MKTEDVVDMLVRYADSPESRTMSTEEAKQLMRSGRGKVTRRQMADALDAYIDDRIAKAIEKAQRAKR